MESLASVDNEGFARALKDKKDKKWPELPDDQRPDNPDHSHHGRVMVGAACGEASALTMSGPTQRCKLLRELQQALFSPGVRRKHRPRHVL